MTVIRYMHFRWYSHLNFVFDTCVTMTLHYCAAIYFVLVRGNLWLLLYSAWEAPHLILCAYCCVILCACILILCFISCWLQWWLPIRLQCPTFDTIAVVVRLNVVYVSRTVFVSMIRVDIMILFVTIHWLFAILLLSSVLIFWLCCGGHYIILILLTCPSCDLQW